MNLECTSDVQDDQRRERTTREEKEKGNRYLNRSGIKMDRRDGERQREGGGGERERPLSVAVGSEDRRG